MVKRTIGFILFALIYATGCAHPPAPEPPDKAQAEFLLVGYATSTEQMTDLAELLEKKKAIYHAIKDMSGKSNIVIVYDASGSMAAKLGEKGPRKFEAAYEGLTQIGGLFGPGDNISLLVFGGRKPFGITKEGVVYKNDFVRAIEACKDVELVYSSPEGFNRRDFSSAIRFLSSEKTYKGDTPIGYAVLKAYEVLKGKSNAKVILITDGEETGPVLARQIEQDKGREERLRKRYRNFDELTVSATDAIERLVNSNIHFSPIIYGITHPDTGLVEKGEQKIREFYVELAKASGSIYLEAVTPFELLNAFIDAELMSVTYDLYSVEGDMQGTLLARGKVGVPLYAREGRYRLKINMEKSLEQYFELKPQVKNVYYFNINMEGKLSVSKGNM